MNYQIEFFATSSEYGAKRDRIVKLVEPIGTFGGCGFAVWQDTGDLDFSSNLTLAEIKQHLYNNLTKEEQDDFLIKVTQV